MVCILDRLLGCTDRGQDPRVSLLVLVCALAQIDLMGVCVCKIQSGQVKDGIGWDILDCFEERVISIKRTHGDLEQKIRCCCVAKGEGTN